MFIPQIVQTDDSKNSSDVKKEDWLQYNNTCLLISDWQLDILAFWLDFDKLQM